MNLSQFVHDEFACQDLRVEVAKFLKVVEANLIHTFECPVCEADLRETYQKSPLCKEGENRGNCAVCKLGIQFWHYVRHEGHPGCEVKVQYPVALADPELRRRLRVEMDQLFPKGIVQYDGERWAAAAREIAEKYHAERKPT